MIIKGKRGRIDPKTEIFDHSTHLRGYSINVVDMFKIVPSQMQQSNLEIRYWQVSSLDQLDETSVSDA